MLPSKSSAPRLRYTVRWGLGCWSRRMKPAWSTSWVERELCTERQKALPVSYKGVRIDCGYRVDLLVEREVIVELKAVAHIEPIHEAQLLSYLKLSGCH